MTENCGGDCWGCIGAIESEMGDVTSSIRVAQEVREGLRNEDLTPRKADAYNASTAAPSLPGSPAAANPSD